MMMEGGSSAQDEKRFLQTFNEAPGYIADIRRGLGSEDEIVMAGRRQNSEVISSFKKEFKKVTLVDEIYWYSAVNSTDLCHVKMDEMGGLFMHKDHGVCSMVYCPVEKSEEDYVLKSEMNRYCYIESAIKFKHMLPENGYWEGIKRVRLCELSEVNIGVDEKGILFADGLKKRIRFLRNTSGVTRIRGFDKYDQLEAEVKKFCSKFYDASDVEAVWDFIHYCNSRKKEFGFFENPNWLVYRDKNITTKKWHKFRDADVVKPFGSTLAHNDEENVEKYYKLYLKGVENSLSTISFSLHSASSSRFYVVGDSVGGDYTVLPMALRPFHTRYTYSPFYDDDHPRGDLQYVETDFCDWAKEYTSNWLKPDIQENLKQTYCLHKTLDLLWMYTWMMRKNYPFYETYQGSVGYATMVKGMINHWIYLGSEWVIFLHSRKEREKVPFEFKELFSFLSKILLSLCEMMMGGGNRWALATCMKRYCDIAEGRDDFDISYANLLFTGRLAMYNIVDTNARIRNATNEKMADIGFKSFSLGSHNFYGFSSEFILVRVLANKYSSHKKCFTRPRGSSYLGNVSFSSQENPFSIGVTDYMGSKQDTETNIASSKCQFSAAYFFFCEVTMGWQFDSWVKPAGFDSILDRVTNTPYFYELLIHLHYSPLFQLCGYRGSQLNFQERSCSIILLNRGLANSVNIALSRMARVMESEHRMLLLPYLPNLMFMYVVFQNHIALGKGRNYESYFQDSIIFKAVSLLYDAYEDDAVESKLLSKVIQDLISMFLYLAEVKDDQITHFGCVMKNLKNSRFFDKSNRAINTEKIDFVLKSWCKSVRNGLNTFIKCVQFAIVNHTKTKKEILWYWFSDKTVRKLFSTKGLLGKFFNVDEQNYFFGRWQSKVQYSSRKCMLHAFYKMNYGISFLKKEMKEKFEIITSQEDRVFFLRHVFRMGKPSPEPTVLPYLVVEKKVILELYLRRKIGRFFNYDKDNKKIISLKQPYKYDAWKDKILPNIASVKLDFFFDKLPPDHISNNVACIVKKCKFNIFFWHVARFDNKSWLLKKENSVIYDLAETSGDEEFTIYSFEVFACLFPELLNDKCKVSENDTRLTTLTYKIRASDVKKYNIEEKYHDYCVRELMFFLFHPVHGNRSFDLLLSSILVRGLDVENVVKCLEYIYRDFDNEYTKKVIVVNAQLKEERNDLKKEELRLSNAYEKKQINSINRRLKELKKLLDPIKHINLNASLLYRQDSKIALKFKKKIALLYEFNRLKTEKKKLVKNAFKGNAFKNNNNREKVNEIFLDINSVTHPVLSKVGTHNLSKNLKGIGYQGFDTYESVYYVKKLIQFILRMADRYCITLIDNVRLKERYNVLASRMKILRLGNIDELKRKLKKVEKEVGKNNENYIKLESQLSSFCMTEKSFRENMKDMLECENSQMCPICYYEGPETHLLIFCDYCNQPHCMKCRFKNDKISRHKCPNCNKNIGYGAASHTVYADWDRFLVDRWSSVLQQIIWGAAFDIKRYTNHKDILDTPLLRPMYEFLHHFFPKLKVRNGKKDNGLQSLLVKSNSCININSNIMLWERTEKSFLQTLIFHKVNPEKCLIADYLHEDKQVKLVHTVYVYVIRSETDGYSITPHKILMPECATIRMLEHAYAEEFGFKKLPIDPAFAQTMSATESFHVYRPKVRIHLVDNDICEHQRFVKNDNTFRFMAHDYSNVELYDFVRLTQFDSTSIVNDSSSIKNIQDVEQEVVAYPIIISEPGKTLPVSTILLKDYYVSKQKAMIMQHMHLKLDQCLPIIVPEKEPEVSSSKKRKNTDIEKEKTMETVKSYIDKRNLIELKVQQSSVSGLSNKDFCKEYHKKIREDSNFAALMSEEQKMYEKNKFDDMMLIRQNCRDGNLVQFIPFVSHMKFSKGGEILIDVKVYRKLLSTGCYDAELYKWASNYHDAPNLKTWAKLKFHSGVFDKSLSWKKSKEEEAKLVKITHDEKFLKTELPWYNPNCIRNKIKLGQAFAVRNTVKVARTFLFHVFNSSSVELRNIISRYDMKPNYDEDTRLKRMLGREKVKYDADTSEHYLTLGWMFKDTVKRVKDSNDEIFAPTIANEHRQRVENLVDMLISLLRIDNLSERRKSFNNVVGIIDFPTLGIFFNMNEDKLFDFICSINNDVLGYGTLIDMKVTTTSSVYVWDKTAYTFFLNVNHFVHTLSRISNTGKSCWENFNMLKPCWNIQQILYYMTGIDKMYDSYVGSVTHLLSLEAMRIQFEGPVKSVIISSRNVKVFKNDHEYQHNMLFVDSIDKEKQDNSDVSDFDFDDLDSDFDSDLDDDNNNNSSSTCGVR